MEAAKKLNSRIKWIDILRGIMMFIVVYGHSSCDTTIKKYLFSFHMPCFFLISGMTFCFNKEFNTIKYLWKKIKLLVIPYFLLNIYVSGLWYWGTCIGTNKEQTLLELIKGILISNTKSGYNMASNTTWFILCLFLTDILFFFFRKICRNDIMLILSVVFTTLSFYGLGFIEEKGGGIWHWEVAFTGIIFYMAGYFFFKNVNFIKEKFLISRWRLAVIVLFLILGYWLSCINSRVSMVNDMYGNVWIFYLSAFLTSFGIIMLVIVLCEYEPIEKCLHPINIIGKITLPYIGFHVPVIRLMEYYIAPFNAENEIMRIIMAIVIYFGLMPVAGLIQKILPNK